MHAVSRVAALLLVALSSACSHEDDHDEHSDGGGEIGCQRDARALDYAQNLEVPGARDALRFVLVASEPAPPARGSNRWTVRVEDRAGAPLEGVSLDVVPFMPDHGHGPSVVPTVTRAGPDLIVDSIDFFMPGLWRVTLVATAPGAEDSADFYFCVEG